MGKDGPAKPAGQRAGQRTRPARGSSNAEKAALPADTGIAPWAPRLARHSGKPRALPQKRRGYVEQESQEVGVVEEEAVKPGSKKFKVCSSVELASARPCACALALLTHVCSRHGA
jgi:hypothetical protein